MLITAIIFYTVLSVIFGKLLLEEIQRHEVFDRCDAHPIVKSFFSHSAKRRIFHRRSLLNPSFVRCKLFLPEHRRCDISPATHPFRDRAQPVYHIAISVFRPHYRSTLFFLNFCLQHMAEMFNLLVESLNFFIVLSY